MQKAVELGAAEVVPVLSERCVSRPDAKSMENRLTRLNRIAARPQSSRGAACCGRFPARSVSADARRASGGGLGLCRYEGEREYKLRDLLADVPQPRTIAFFIGPEGGISEPELELLRRHGLPAVSLGRRILRTETAGLYVLSAISAILE